MHLGKSNNTGRQMIDATPFFKSNRGCTLHAILWSQDVKLQF